MEVTFCFLRIMSDSGKLSIPGATSSTPYRRVVDLGNCLLVRFTLHQTNLVNLI